MCFERGHWPSDLVDTVDDVLKAHAHDQVLWLREQNLIDGRRQPGEKLSFVLKQVLLRPELRPWRYHVGGVNADPVEAISASVLAHDAPQFMLGTRIRGRNEQPEFPSEAADVWIATRRVYAEPFDRLAVVNDPGSSEGRHGRCVRIRNEDGLPG